MGTFVRVGTEWIAWKNTCHIMSTGVVMTLLASTAFLSPLDIGLVIFIGLVVTVTFTILIIKIMKD